MNYADDPQTPLGRPLGQDWANGADDARRGLPLGAGRRSSPASPKTTSSASRRRSGPRRWRRCATWSSWCSRASRRSPRSPGRPRPPPAPRATARRFFGRVARFGALLDAMGVTYYRVRGVAWRGVAGTRIRTGPARPTVRTLRRGYGLRRQATGRCSAADERRERTMSGVVHFEIPADDEARAREFYSAAFDWRLDALPELGYTSVVTTPVDESTQAPLEPGAINGGMFERSGDLATPDHHRRRRRHRRRARAHRRARRCRRAGEDRDPGHGVLRLLPRHRGQRPRAVDHGGRRRLTGHGSHAQGLSAITVPRASSV